MVVHEMHIAEKKLMEKIMTGEKTVDVRLYDLKRMTMEPSHYIVFSCPDLVDEDGNSKKAVVKIESTKLYDCPIGLLMDVDIEKECGLENITSPAEAFSQLITKYYPYDEGLEIMSIRFSLAKDKLEDALKALEKEKES